MSWWLIGAVLVAVGVIGLVIVVGAVAGSIAAEREVRRDQRARDRRARDSAVQWPSDMGGGW